MSRDGGRPIRGCRPGKYSIPEEECDEAEVVRLANVEAYARRVRAGLPIFEEPADPLGRLVSGHSAS
jgi:hypothetical protein